jgi:hypothetical protein
MAPPNPNPPPPPSPPAGGLGGLPAGLGALANLNLSGLAQSLGALAKLDLSALSGSGGFAGRLAGLASAVGSVTQALAMLPQAVQTVVGTVTGYVSALNPALMAQFNEVLRDLNATIGVAFLPVISIATGLARELGSYLLPVMRQLNPIVARLAAAASSVLVPVIQAVAENLAGLLPVADMLAGAVAVAAPLVRAELALLMTSLRVLTPFVEAAAAVFATFVPVLTAAAGIVEDVSRGLALVAGGIAEGLRAFNHALGDVFGGLFNVDLAGSAEALRSVVQDVVKGLILLSAQLAVFAFGDVGKGYVRGLMREGPARQDNTGLAPAQGAGLKSFSDFGKDMAVAASMAGMGAGAAKTEKDFLADIRGDLGKILEGTNTLQKMIEESFVAAWKRIKGGAEKGAEGAVFDGVRFPLNNPFIRNAIRGANPGGLDDLLNQLGQ